MPEERAYGFTWRTILLMVVVAATAFSAGQYTQRHGGSWQLLLSQRQNSFTNDMRAASTFTGASHRHDKSSDGQWCWVKAKCDGIAAAEPSGLGRTGAAAAIDQASAAARQQSASVVVPDNNGQQTVQAAAPEAESPELRAAKAPQQTAQFVSAAQEVSKKGGSDKQDAEQKPVLDVVGEAIPLSDVGIWAMGTVLGLNCHALRSSTTNAGRLLPFLSQCA